MYLVFIKAEFIWSKIVNLHWKNSIVTFIMFQKISVISVFSLHKSIKQEKCDNVQHW